MVGIVVVQSFFGGLLNILDAINALSPFWCIGRYPRLPLQPSHLDTLVTAEIVLLGLSVAGFRRLDSGAS